MWLYLMTFLCSSRLFSAMTPPPPKATHCEKPLKASLLSIPRSRPVALADLDLRLLEGFLDDDPLESFLLPSSLCYFRSVLASGDSGFIKFVWSEGSLGYISAMKLVSTERGETYTCRGKDADAFFASIVTMNDQNNLIAYATPTDNPDFSFDGSIAGTAWSYFVAANFNPFQPDNALVK